MNKAYLIVPLVLTLAFAGIYINFNRGFEAKQTAMKEDAAAKIKAKQKKDADDREKAMAMAVEASKKRTAERLQREKVEEDKKTARQDAEDRRTRTYDERNKLRDQVTRLKKDLEDVKSTLGKVEEEKKHSADEAAFLKNYVKQAEANVAYYYDLLSKIDAAEKAKAEAAAAAAAAAKKAS